MPHTYPLLPFYAGSEEILLPVSHIADGYARGPDGTCAFCKGDPCNEDSSPETPIARFYAAWPGADTCPVCEGRPT